VVVVVVVLVLVVVVVLVNCELKNVVCILVMLYLECVLQLQP